MRLEGANFEKAKERLAARLEELRRPSDAAAEARAPIELDRTSVGRLSRMDSLQAQAMAQAAQRLRARDIERVMAALRRIEEGEYGWCAACGEEIAPGRLAVDPAIATCIRCASGTDR
jgi:DnaK suppressor protein